MTQLSFIQYTDRMTGKGHPTLPDTLNTALRSLLSQSGYNPDANPVPGLHGPVFNVKAYGALGDGAADDTTAIHAARDAAGLNGRLYFPTGTYRTAGLVANVAGQLWELAPDATVKLLNTATTHGISITASGVEIRGGIIDGNKAGGVSGTARGISVAPTAASPPCIVRQVTVQNAFDDGIFFFQADDSQCLDCRVTGGRQYGINVRASRRVLVSRCYADASTAVVNTASTAIEVSSTFAGTDCDGCRVVNNTCIPGPVAVQGWGIECQVAGGNTTNDVVVSNNLVWYLVNCTGAISMSAVQESTVTSNTIDANGFTGQFGIEIVADAQCVAANNVLRGGTTGWNNGISCDQATGCVIQGNEISGGSTAGDLRGIFIGSSLAVNVRRNQIIGNRILLGAAATATRGIYVLANNAGTDASENVIFANQVECAGDALSRGIVVELSAGTLANTIIAYNILRSCNEGIRQFNDVGTVIGPNVFISCTNNYGSSAPGTNGRKVDIASISADRGDASITLVAETDQTTQLFATTLTANRTVTLPASRRVRGARYRVVRTGLGAFTIDVGPGIKTMPSATAAFVDVEFDGTVWRLTGFGTL